MRILFVCHRFPFPPSRGGKIRPFNMIRHLNEHHEVTVASLVRSEAEASAGRGIQLYCRKFLIGHVTEVEAWGRMLLRLPTPTPSSMGNFFSPDLRKAIQKEIAKTGFDLIVVHCSSAAQYVEDVADVPKLLDFGDMDSQKWLAYAKVFAPPKSLGYWLEGIKLQRAERRLAGKFDLCTCTTRSELASLETMNPASPTDWFPNGVDLDYFAPGREPYDPSALCFVGRMDYFPNQDCVIEFCTETLPLIRKERPDATLSIIGADPPERIRRLQQIDGVVVTGTVPDVRPFVRHTVASVAPLKIARGTQNKILESMAMGVPVIASSRAAAGVDAIPGEHILTADHPADYAHAAIRLLEDPTLRRRLSEAGRARMETNHTWRASMAKFERLACDLAKRTAQSCAAPLAQMS